MKRARQDRPRYAKVAENGEQDRLEMFGAIGLTCGLVRNNRERGPRQPISRRIRKNRIWLPESNTNPNTVLENRKCARFSAPLTKGKSSEMDFRCVGFSYQMIKQQA
jgi:hypothetical protein